MKRDGNHGIATPKIVLTRGQWCALAFFAAYVIYYFAMLSYLRTHREIYSMFNYITTRTMPYLPRHYWYFALTAALAALKGGWWFSAISTVGFFVFVPLSEPLAQVIHRDDLLLGMMGYAVCAVIGLCVEVFVKRPDEVSLLRLNGFVAAASLLLGVVSQLFYMVSIIWYLFIAASFWLLVQLVLMYRAVRSKTVNGMHIVGLVIALPLWIVISIYASGSYYVFGL